MQNQLRACKVSWLLLITVHPDQQCCQVPAGLRKQYSCCSQAPCRMTISTNSRFCTGQTSVSWYRSGRLWLLHSAGSVSEMLPFVELLWLCLFTGLPLCFCFFAGVRGAAQRRPVLSCWPCISQGGSSAGESRGAGAAPGLAPLKKMEVVRELCSSLALWAVDLGWRCLGGSQALLQGTICTL